MTNLIDRSGRHGIAFSDELVWEIEHGFGPRSEGEDAFDALLGLLGMIEVADRRRPEGPSDRVGNSWEGWILGQAE
jgi:hypothetical protein